MSRLTKEEAERMYAEFYKVKPPVYNQEEEVSYIVNTRNNVSKKASEQFADDSSE